MKHMRLISLLLATLLALLPLSALAEEAYPELDVTVVIDPDEEEYIPSEEDFIEIASEPYIPEHVEKTVFGRDDRTTIRNTSSYPYCAIAYLKVDYACSCKGYTGTGFMVAPDCLMTASHVVYCSKHLKPITKITMYFGYVSDKNYYYKYETTNPTFWYNPQFSSGNGLVYAEWDYAYVRVPSSVGNATGNFGLSARSDTQLTSTQAEVAGYKWGVLKTASGYLNVSGARRLTYTIDMEPGNSGCPVFTADYYVVGINVSHSETSNNACRITQDIINEMYGNGFFK